MRLIIVWLLLGVTGIGCLSQSPRLTNPAKPTTPLATSARLALEQFMQARIARQEQAVLDLLTERLRSQIQSDLYQLPLFQVSNPCWYRYLILSLDETPDQAAHARVRVYEHFWSGDNGGGLPHSWEQELELVRTPKGWLVDQLSNAENEREELREPHGWTVSACRTHP